MPAATGTRTKIRSNGIGAPSEAGGGRIDFEAVNQAALSHLHELCEELLPGGRVQGREYVVGDLTGADGKSCRINLKTGKWADFASDARGGDPISLVAAFHRSGQSEAARWLADWLGIDLAGGRHGKKPPRRRPARQNDGLQATTAPAVPENVVHPRLGRPAATWTYYDEAGAVLGLVCRFDTNETDSKGKQRKTIMPFTPWRDRKGEITWRWRTWQAPRPLYGLDRLAKTPNLPALLVEGEKACDAAQRLLSGLVAAVTWPSGTPNVTRTDWRPLRGRHVTIWPDADDPGRKAAEEVAQAALAAGAAEAHIVKPPDDVPEGWDLADAEAEGWSGKQVLAWIRDHRRAVRKDSTAQRSDGKNKPKLRLVSGIELEPEPVTWLWRGFLPAGMLTILAGRPGAGKTTIALDLAATITRAGTWPDGTMAPSGKVAIWSGEDDARHVLLPRFLAAGGDREKILFIDMVDEASGGRPFEPAKDMLLLEEAMADHDDIRLIIIDPIVSATRGDSHKNSEVRKSLQPIVDLACRREVAIVGISHFAKGTAGGDPVERVAGSIAFGALARVILAAARIEDEDKDLRLLARAKCNVGPSGGGFYYRILPSHIGEHGIETTRVAWAGSVEGDARSLLVKAETMDGGESGRLGEAIDFLREELAEGPVPAKEIQKRAVEAGIARTTLQRAKDQLGIKASRRGFAHGSWVWTFPEEPVTDSPIDSTPGTRNLCENVESMEDEWFDVEGAS